MTHTQLDQNERYQISALLDAKHAPEAIGRRLKRSGNTIRDELKRGRAAPDQPYCPDLAHRLAKARKANNARRITVETWTQVEMALQKKHSPEQIAGRLKSEHKISVCHMSIYRRIANNRRAGGMLHRHLRCGKPYRKAHTKETRGCIPNRRDITERPEIVEKRARIGDWEVDLVIGAQHQGAFITLLERTSGLYLCKWVPDKTAERVARGVIQLLTPFKPLVHTITSDNGLEFAQHEWIAQALKADYYFAKPYASWQRGSNENANGLLRQYFPKGTPFHADCVPDLLSAFWAMNERPRKRHGFKTPIEIFACHAGMAYIDAARNIIH